MKKIRIIVGTCFITVGLIFHISSIQSEHSKIIEEKNQISYTLNSIVGYRSIDLEKYTSILVIPKINLRKGIYDIDDSKNNIDSNIMIHKDSIYPDKENSNIILIAHSGVGEKAYFNRLEELDQDSLIEYYYNHTKYVYKIDNRYYINKTGKADIKYYHNKKTITLITCSNNNSQVVYIGYLIDEINY